jgi:hypothetical protein
MSRQNKVLTATLAAAAIAWPGLIAQAQLVSRAPFDFESCADLADEAATREAKAAALTECNATFAGRRKPGGGYSYYDFMQNRSFDIAGPNPTPQEQKYIDQQYTHFLDTSRPDRAAAASALNQAAAPLPRQVLSPPAPPSLQPQPASLSSAKVPLPAPRRPAAAALDAKSHGKAADCAEHRFSCDFPLLAAPINGLRKLFGASEAIDEPRMPPKNIANHQAKYPVRNPANDQVNNDVKDKRSAVDGRSPM